MVNVTASSVGVTGCSDTSVAQTIVSFTAPSAVTLVPVDAALTIVCPGVASRVLNYTFSTLPVGVGLSSVTLTSSGPACSVANPTNGETEGHPAVQCCSTDG